MARRVARDERGRVPCVARFVDAGRVRRACCRGVPCVDARSSRAVAHRRASVFVIVRHGAYRRASSHAVANRRARTWARRFDLI
ncbi:hypothetical protein WI23_29670 [Burkholderia oklahomensis C6786]|nr:hypothetical protein WI23_29670 [Burkholderia oklahomensis C6786]KUY47252.1 hypothetical protein WI23_30085 [Burkholderia oklahomensis C6786]